MPRSFVGRESRRAGGGESGRPIAAPSSRRPTGRGGRRVGDVVLGGALGLALALAPLATAAPASAQEFPGIGGFDVRIGGNSPVNENAGITASVDADLGFIESPFLRTLVGFSFFRGGVEREGMSDGSFSAAGLRAGLRADFYELGTVRPYALATITGHNVTADVPDPGTEQLLEGLYFGLGAGIGAMVALDDPAHFGVVTELRRVFANNIGHWAFEVGFRWTPLGPDMYRRPIERDREVRERDLRDRERVDERAAERREARDEERRQMEADRQLREALRALDWDVRTMETVRETERGTVIVLGRGLFERDGPRLSDQGRRDLARIAETLRRHPPRDIRVEVQTDSRQFAEDRLAERRAESVRSALVLEGLDHDRVSAFGQEADREERVEIVIRTTRAFNR